MSDAQTLIAFIGALVLLLTNLGALVWGASAIKASVDALATASTKMSAAITRLDDRVDAHDIEIALLKRESDRDHERERRFG